MSKLLKSILLSAVLVSTSISAAGFSSEEHMRVGLKSLYETAISAANTGNTDLVESTIFQCLVMEGAWDMTPEHKRTEKMIRWNSKTLEFCNELL